MNKLIDTLIYDIENGVCRVTEITSSQYDLYYYTEKKWLTNSAVKILIDQGIYALAAYIESRLVYKVIKGQETSLIDKKLMDAIQIRVKNDKSNELNTVIEKFIEKTASIRNKPELLKNLTSLIKYVENETYRLCYKEDEVVKIDLHNCFIEVKTKNGNTTIVEPNNEYFLIMPK